MIVNTFCNVFTNNLKKMKYKGIIFILFLSDRGCDEAAAKKAKKMRIFLISLSSLWLLAALSHAQYSENYRPGFILQNPCVSKQTCSECLQTPSCAWCMKEVSSFS